MTYHELRIKSVFSQTNLIGTWDLSTGTGISSI